MDFIEVTVSNQKSVDNRAPIISITNPNNGAVISNKIKIEGIASDDDGIVQSVEIKIDNGSWIMAKGTTSWIYEWNSKIVDDGFHNIFARCYDGT